MMKTLWLIGLVLLAAAGACSGSTAVLIGSAPSATAARYYAPDSASAAYSTETAAKTLFSTAGTLTHFYVWLSAAPGAGKSWTVTVRVNEASSAQAVTITGAAVTTGEDADTVAISADDNVCVYVASSGSPAAATIWWCIDYEPAAANEQWLSCVTDSLATSGTGYYWPKGRVATSNGPYVLFPQAGTLDKLHIELDTAPGDGATRFFNVEYNGATTNDLDITAGATDTYVVDDTNSVSISAGDRIRIITTLTGTPAGSIAHIGLRFVPTTANTFSLLSTSNSDMATDADSYFRASSSFGAYQTTEAAAVAPVRALTISNMYLQLSGSPDNGGGTQSYTFTLREGDGTTQADASPTLQAVIQETATTGNATATVVIEKGNYIDVEITPAGTPTARAARGLGMTATVLSSTPIPVILKHKKG